MLTALSVLSHSFIIVIVNISLGICCWRTSNSTYKHCIFCTPLNVWKLTVSSQPLESKEKSMWLNWPSIRLAIPYYSACYESTQKYAKKAVFFDTFFIDPLLFDALVFGVGYLYTCIFLLLHKAVFFTHVSARFELVKLQCTEQTSGKWGGEYLRMQWRKHFGQLHKSDLSISVACSNLVYACVCVCSEYWTLKNKALLLLALPLPLLPLHIAVTVVGLFSPFFWSCDAIALLSIFDTFHPKKPATDSSVLYDIHWW